MQRYLRVENIKIYTPILAPIPTRIIPLNILLISKYIILSTITVGLSVIVLLNLFQRAERKKHYNNNEIIIDVIAEPY